MTANHENTPRRKHPHHNRRSFLAAGQSGAVWGDRFTPLPNNTQRFFRVRQP